MVDPTMLEPAKPGKHKPPATPESAAYGAIFLAVILLWILQHRCYRKRKSIPVVTNSG